MVGGDPTGPGGGCATSVGGSPRVPPTPPMEDEMAIVGFGNNSIGTASGIRWMEPWYSDSLAPSPPPPSAKITMVASGTIDRLYIDHANPGGNGNNIVYTLYVNTAPVALVVTAASTSTGGSDLANSVAVVPGDEVELQISKAASIGSNPGPVTATMRFAPS